MIKPPSSAIVNAPYAHPTIRDKGPIVTEDPPSMVTTA
jgi:hypothetical protein